jgi:putative NIF3 family GTP cyclohydrolase 1 type 2
MKLRTLYDIAVANAIKMDPRSNKDVKDAIKANKKAYAKAKGADKAYFDMESLNHPYDDSRILNGSGGEEVRDVMVGIDIGVDELLLADKLMEKGMNIDLVISHHPSGRALANLHKVMPIQSDIWREKYGLSREVAEGIMKDRIQEVSRGLAPANHTRVMDAAKLLGIPFMCTHTVADNCVTSYLQKIFDQKKPKKLGNVVSMIKAIPEYKDAIKYGAGPFILIGEENTDAGKIFVDMTGGTSGPSKLFARLQQAGVKTIVGMHCKEEGYKIAKSEFINYVIAGHMASDNLGMNLMFDAIEKHGRLNFIECSGFRRFRRR